MTIGESSRGGGYGPPGVKRVYSVLDRGDEWKGLRKTRIGGRSGLSLGEREETFTV